MDQGLLPRRYAKALYKFAVEKHADKAVYAAMQNIEAFFEAEPTLQQTIANPFIEADKKIALLETASALTGTEAKGASEVKAVLDDFFSLLVKNRRIDIVRGVALAYMLIYRKANNIYGVTIASAAPLSDADRKRLHNIIEKHLEGAKAEYSYTVDPSLIGGFVVGIENERLDASVKNEIEQLRLNLLK